MYFLNRSKPNPNKLKKMSKKTKCPFSPGDIVKDLEGIRFEVIALVASGDTLVWLWPEGETLEGTN